MNLWTYRFLYAAGTVTGVVGLAAVVYFRPKSNAIYYTSSAAFGLLTLYSAYRAQQEVRAIATDAIQALPSLPGSFSVFLPKTPQQQVVEKAESMLGLTETSPEIQAIILGYQEHAKWAVRDPKADWCLMWASWVVRQVRPDIPWMASVSVDLVPRAAKNQAAPGERVGAIAYRPGHAAIVVEEDAQGRITTIDGNASDKVMRIGPVPPGSWVGYWKWWNGSTG